MGIVRSSCPLYPRSTLISRVGGSHTRERAPDARGPAARQGCACCNIPSCPHALCDRHRQRPQHSWPRGRGPAAVHSRAPASDRSPAPAHSGAKSHVRSPRASWLTLWAGRFRHASAAELQAALPVEARPRLHPRQAHLCVRLPSDVSPLTTRSILAEQIESQFAELNSRKKPKGGITEQVIAELLARPSAKLILTRVVQPSTDRLQAILVRLVIDRAYPTSCLLLIA